MCERKLVHDHKTHNSGSSNAVVDLFLLFQKKAELADGFHANIFGRHHDRVAVAIVMHPVDKPLDVWSMKCRVHGAQLHKPINLVCVFGHLATYRIVSD